MTDPRPITREDLAKFLPNQRAIRAFERLFVVVPQLVETVPIELTAIHIELLEIQTELLEIQDEFILLHSELDSTTVLAGSADAAAISALDLIDRLTGLLELVALAPRETMEPANENPLPLPALGTLSEQDADQVTVAGGSIIASLTNNTGSLIDSATTLTDGAGVALGTLTNAPSAGNPAKWATIDDNGTTRYLPLW